MSDDGAGIRVGDADRDQIADVLSRHAADGRLTVDELDERLGRLYAAVTRGDARAVMAGLPPLAPEAHHHWHIGGHGRDGDAPTLPDWFASGFPAPQAESAQATTLSPGALSAASGPSDKELQAAYDKWREAHAKAKAARKAHRRAEAAGNKDDAWRMFDQSLRLTAAEKSARAKYDALQKQRPGWTPVNG